MNWSEFHGESERLASAADVARWRGDADAARENYLAAAQAELSALRELAGADDPDTYGATAVSAAALFFKGEALTDADRIAREALGAPFLPAFARTQLDEITEAITRRAAATVASPMAKLAAKDRNDAEKPKNVATGLQSSTVGAGAQVGPTSGYEIAIVKWFNRAQGFGFLTRGEGTENIFFHVESFRSFGMTDLTPGDAVLVRYGDGPKGLTATEIRPLESKSLSH